MDEMTQRSLSLGYAVEASKAHYPNAGDVISMAEQFRLYLANGVAVDAEIAPAPRAMPIYKFALPYELGDGVDVRDDDGQWKSGQVTGITIGLHKDPVYEVTALAGGIFTRTSENLRTDIPF